MPKYIFTYHQPAGYVPGSDKAAMAAWQSFFEGIADRVIEPGLPVFERTSIGEVGGKTQLGGYSIVEADDLEHAATLAKGCPSIRYGGGVQVGQLNELPPDHIASQLSARIAAK